MTKRIFTGLMITIFFAGIFTAKAGDWKRIDGLNNYINKIFFPKNDKNVVIVASDGLKTDFSTPHVQFPLFGHGYKISYDKGESFGDYDTSLVRFSVYDIVELSDNNTWLASVKSYQDRGVLRSADNGKTWNKDSVKCNSESQIYKLAATPDKVYGSVMNPDNGGGFVYSTDKFDNCIFSTDVNFQTRDVAVSPSNPDLVFIAGDDYDNDGSNSGVYRSYDGGLHWIKDETGLENKRVLCILPLSNDPATILCGVDSLTGGMESQGKGIYISRDTGRTWIKTGANNMKVFDIAQHPSNPQYLIAACGLGGIVISSDFGQRWGGDNSGLPEAKSVRTVAIPDYDVTNEGFIAFAGVYTSYDQDPEGGLYKSGRLFTSAEDNPSYLPAGIGIEGIFPQPAGKTATIKWYNSTPGKTHIMIIDNLGRIAADLGNEYYESGNHVLPWYINESISQGVYSVLITDGNTSAVGKIVIEK